MVTARAIWKAELCIGVQRVPVKLFSASQDQRVHFRLLHAKDLAPVQQEMVDSIDLQPVANKDALRGIEVSEGVFAIITEKERRELEPTASRDICIEQMIEPALIDWRWLNKPYYLGPDGDEEGYFALAQAMAKRNRVGAARWVMRKKRYQGALFSHAGHLLLQTLRHSEEVVELEEVITPADRSPDERERKLAEQLIAMLSDRFDPEAYHNEHSERVRALIEAKVSGQKWEVERPTPKLTPKHSLVDDLKASLSREGSAASAH